MPNLKTRPATLADLPTIMKLINQDDMSPDNQLSLQESQEIFEKIANTGCHKIFVALFEGAIIGTFALILVQSLTHGGGKSAVVEDVVIDSRFQGQGFGRAMMEVAADAAREFGAGKLVLSSGKARTKAHEFYEHLGYAIDGYRFGLALK